MANPKGPIRSVNTRQDLGSIEAIAYNDPAGAKKVIVVEPVVKEAVVALGSGTAATAVLDLTTDITLTSAATGISRNGSTFTIQVNPAAANPTDTVLADFSGTAENIVVTITPNDGTNNGATPVNLTTAELVELINTGAVVGKTITLTDPSSLRDDQTATGGDATNLADSGEGDGVSGVFSGGDDGTAAAAVGSGKYVKVTGTSYTLRLINKAYDTTKIYQKGDVVSNGSSIYLCFEDGVTGTFDVTKWKRVAAREIGPVAITAGSVVCTGRWHNTVSEAGFLVDDESEIKHTRTRD